MDPRTQFARIFSPNAGDFAFPRPDAASLRSSVLQETYARPDAGDYGAPRRVGGHHFGSPAMQSFMADQAPHAAGDVTVQRAMQSMASRTAPPIQKSDVDQYGNPINTINVAPQPLQGGPPPPQGERQQGQEAPPAAGASSGTSTTTMLLLGGGAFLAVMLLLKKKKR